MTQEVEVAELARGLDQSNVFWAKLLATVLRNEAPFKRVRMSRASARDLQRIFAVRLERFREGGGPACENLERFVDDLDSIGDGMVELFSVDSAARRWIVVLKDQEPLSYTAVGHESRD